MEAADGSSCKICEAEEDFRKFGVRQTFLFVCVLVVTSVFVNAMLFAGRHFPSRLRCFLGWPGDTILSWQVKTDFHLLTPVWLSGWTVWPAGNLPVFSMHCVKQEVLGFFWNRIWIMFQGFQYTRAIQENWETLIFVQEIKYQWGCSNFATWILPGNRRQDVLYYLTVRSKRNIVAHACLS